METFAEVLSSYVQRAGISDTELARAVGVSRQTIFRWREGLTSRPNNREDVLAIAEKLRLSPEERDHLLLVAGFRPEDMLPLINGEIDQISAENKPAETFLDVQGEIGVQGAEAKDVATHPTEAEEKRLSGKFRHSRYRWTFAGLASVLLAALIVWLVIGGDSDNDTGASNSTSPTPSMSIDSDAFKPAIEGETLLVVTNFAEADNITNQLVEALQREIHGSRIAETRVDIWPETIKELNQASKLLMDSNAVLIVYGESGIGNAIVQFFPALDQSVGVSEFIIGSTSNVQLEIRSLALVLLGHLYIVQDDPHQALTFLAQARNIMQSNAEKNENIALAVDALILQVYEDIEKEQT